MSRISGLSFLGCSSRREWRALPTHPDATNNKACREAATVQRRPIQLLPARASRGSTQRVLARLLTCRSHKSLGLRSSMLMVSPFSRRKPGSNAACLLVANPGGCLAIGGSRHRSTVHGRLGPQNTGGNFRLASTKSYCCRRLIGSLRIRHDDVIVRPPRPRNTPRRRQGRPTASFRIGRRCDLFRIGRGGPDVKRGAARPRPHPGSISGANQSAEQSASWH